MPRKYLIIFFFMAFVGAGHAVPLRVAFAQAQGQTQENGQPCPPECAVDTMEIVTWYPSPYNEYEELRLYPISDSNSQCNSDTRGLMYYDSDEDKVKLCKGPAGLNNWQDLGDGFWQLSGNDISNTNNGIVKVGGFKMSVGAQTGYVFTSDADGIAAWKSVTSTNSANYTTAARPACNSLNLGMLIFDTEKDEEYVCSSSGWRSLDPFVIYKPLTYSGSNHTVNECVSARGTVYDTGTLGTLCRFKAGSCPSGWNQAENWQRYNSASWGGDSCGRHKSTGPDVFLNMPANVKVSEDALSRCKGCDRAYGYCNCDSIDPQYWNRGNDGGRLVWLCPVVGGSASDNRVEIGCK